MTALPLAFIHLFFAQEPPSEEAPLSNLHMIIDMLATLVEAGGVAIIVAGILIAAVYFVRNVFSRRDISASYSKFRQTVGLAILLGLELLVAGDIIHTVAIDFSFANVGILGLIVFIRTFLGWTLTVEIEGRWPWQKSADSEV